jgi:hypothetical protein
MKKRYGGLVRVIVLCWGVYTSPTLGSSSDNDKAQLAALAKKNHDKAARELIEGPVRFLDTLPSPQESSFEQWARAYNKKPKHK